MPSRRFTIFSMTAASLVGSNSCILPFIIAGNYKKELNPQNPLGMRGEIAIAYAELMMQMWSGYNSYVSPRNFKVG